VGKIYIATVEKQPAEIIPVGVDFRKNLSVGEALTMGSCSSVVYNEGGEDVSDDLIVENSLSISGTVLSVKVTGGLSGVRYKLSIRGGTTLGNLYEGDLLLKIVD
jgi:hypothetical protein